MLFTHVRTQGDYESQGAKKTFGRIFDSALRRRTLVNLLERAGKNHQKQEKTKNETQGKFGSELA